jgi:tetratricopeptide (TPR) repeat protein
LAKHLKPSTYLATWGLWKVCEQLERHNLACRLAEELVRIGPKNQAGFVACCESYRRAGRLIDSARAARKALEIVPDDDQALIVSAQTHLRLGDYHSALEEANRALSYNKDLGKRSTPKTFA